METIAGHPFSHESNLTTKVASLEGPSQRVAIAAVKRYRVYRDIVEKAIRTGQMNLAVQELNDYLDYAKGIEKKHKEFNWRSDYAGSIFPEFLMMAVFIEAEKKDINCVFSSKNSVVEINLSSSGDWQIRRKNQDFSVGKISKTHVFESPDAIEFIIPKVVAEVKTNIDINKLNGLDYSASRLKTTFPECKYLLVTETIDFSLDDNYITTSVDEIYCLRKQMRSRSRKSKDPISTEIVSILIDDIVNFLDDIDDAAGHVYDRLESGKLIGG